MGKPILHNYTGSTRGTQEMASFIPWGNQFYTIIRTQLPEATIKKNRAVCFVVLIFLKTLQEKTIPKG